MSQTPPKKNNKPPSHKKERSFRLFPRSLRQLVLLAFLLVISPLLVLTMQAYHSLYSLSTRTADVNEKTLNDARRSETITNIALNMERSYRQYCVLNSDSLRILYLEQLQRYRALLRAHIIEVEEQIALYDKLDTLLTKIETVQCDNTYPTAEASEVLRQFAIENKHTLDMTRDIIFSRGNQLQVSIAQQGAFFGQLALTVFILSLFLILLFTHMIIEPVKIVNKMISRLGEGEFITTAPRPVIIVPLELKELAKRIVWLSERLAWLESQRHEFLRHISHELKTPLASLREGTALLADQVVGILTNDQKEVVTILDDSSQQLHHLIEQLLDYNRKIADFTDEKRDVNLEKLLSDVLTTYSLIVRKKTMTTLCDLEVSHYLGEEKLLIRIIDNLYSNAVHYGKEAGTIWISSKLVNDYVQIDIANSGNPIPEKDHSMLFEPFYQGTRYRKGAVKGSGLGLSIARDCTLRMKGNLSYVTVDYADVCFRIKLPIQK